MRSLFQDVRFAIRTLRRRRAFTLIAIGTVVIGIGSATAMYSVLDGVVFRPLAFEHPDRLVAVWKTNPQWRKEPILAHMWDHGTLSLPEFTDWRAAQTSFADVAAWSWTTVTLGGGEVPERVALIQASASLLPTLGVRPVLGRAFTADENVVNGPPVVMLTYATWAARFNRDPHVLGRAIMLDDKPYTIVGVLPRGLALALSDDDVSLWTPLGQDSASARRPGIPKYLAIGRLKPGILIERATMETDRILRGSADPSKHGTYIADWHVDQTREVRAPLFILLGAVGLLQLIACANLAVLLIGEGATREQEMASRIALGASRTRLFRQLLTESVLLTSVGAAIATVFAWGGTKALVALAPSGIPGLVRVGVDFRVLAFSIAIAAVTGILAGLAPAVILSRSATASLLRSSAGSARGRGLLQRAMIATEVALSVTLLVSAGLLSRTFEKITAVNPGFRVDHLLSVRPALPRTQYSDSIAQREFYRVAVERIGAIPGVQAVAAGGTPPFSGPANRGGFEIEGVPLEPDAPAPQAQDRIVTVQYFRTLGIPLLAGRIFTDADGSDAPLVIVVSQSMASRDWPGESVLGKRVRYFGAWRTVIGVVGNVKSEKLSDDDQAAMYEPLAQRPSNQLTLLVRTAGDPIAVLRAIRAGLHEVAPTVSIVSADPTADLMERSLAEERYRTVLISLFAIVAAALATAGVYGVTARAVNGRRREVGIRMALGATARSVVRLVMGHTMAGVTIGVPVGFAAALAATRFLSPYLFEVTTTDSITYTTVFGFLITASVVASWMAARRAAQIDPALVLRED